MSLTPAMLISDLDGTLSGTPEEDRAVSRWLATRCFPFVVATGRSLEEARQELLRRQLPLPDVFVSDVGTQIAHRTGRNYRRDVSWPRVAEGFSPRGIASIVEGTLGLEPQGRSSDHKLSYLASSAQAALAISMVRQAGIEADSIFSQGRYLDFLPPDSSKGPAVAHVARQLSIPLSAVVAVGDSENDRTMLTLVGMPAVVANHAPELDDLVQASPVSARPLGARLSDRRRPVYVSRQPGGAGVVEAFEHYQACAPGARPSLPEIMPPDLNRSA